MSKGKAIIMKENTAKTKFRWKANLIEENKRAVNLIKNNRYWGFYRLTLKNLDLPPYANNLSSFKPPSPIPRDFQIKKFLTNTNIYACHVFLYMPPKIWYICIPKKKSSRYFKNALFLTRRVYQQGKHPQNYFPIYLLNEFPCEVSAFNGLKQVGQVEMDFDFGYFRPWFNYY